jgi:hypothetical protein
VADTVYNVRVKYNLDKSKAEADANSLTKTFERLGAVISSAFAVHRVMDFGLRVGKLVSEFEQFRLQLATMLSGYGAPGFESGAQGFERALRVSQPLMREILKEAAKLPVYASETVEIFRAVVPGALSSGHSILGQNSAMEMTKRLALISQTIPGGANTVSREFQALMEGRAIGRNDLFARIRLLMNDGKGLGAKEFNKLSDEDRWKQVDAALKKMFPQAAVDAQANSIKAIVSTTLTWGQVLADIAGKAPVRVITEQFKKLNDWLEQNRSKVEEFAATIGDKLGSALSTAFDAVRSAFEFIVQHKDTILEIAKIAGIAFLGGKVGGFTGGGVGSTLAGNAGLGVLLNSVTGGNAVTGGIMGVFGALASFGGALGTASLAIVGFAAAANMAAEALDKAHKEDINKDDQIDRLSGLYKSFRSGGGDSVYGVVRSIIQDRGMMGYMGAIKDDEFSKLMRDAGIDPTRGTYGSGHKTRAQEFYDMFSDVSYRMRESVAFGPRVPTAEEKLMQKLYDPASGRIPRKQDVNVNVVIKQDISTSEDPDRILHLTKRALNEALISPIESGYNPWSPLR